MNTEPVNALTHCNHCRSPLSYDEKRNCKVCLTCHPHPNEQKPVEEKERHYVDVPWTEERIIEVIDKVVPDMILGLLRNWHIQKPPVLRDEIPEAIGVGSGVAVTELEKPETWRQTAKRLGISLFDNEKRCPRKKVDVLNDIEEKLNVPV